MTAIRVLVVDDSVVIRKALCDTLAADAEIEVAGAAADGRSALAQIPQLKPDVITLDVEMPVMNGLETLKELRKSYPRIPVVMFSMLTERGAAATLDALALGACDYVTKPVDSGSLAASLVIIRGELIPKIKALCRRNYAPPAVRVAAPQPPRAGQAIEIVAIGTSTGGPNALAEVLPGLSKELSVPIVIVQHMPPIFTRLLAERLAKRCEIGVAEGRAGAELAPGQAVIAPGNFHMTVARAGLRARLELNQAPPEHSCRPAVDVMFRSVSSAYGAGVLAVVMTGMGADGVAGAQQIRQAGGQIIIQDEASAVVWGMPGLVQAAGLADGIYPLQQMAQEITRRVMLSRARRQAVAATASASALTQNK